MKRFILIALAAMSFACNKNSSDGSAGPSEPGEQSVQVPVPNGCHLSADQKVAVCSVRGASAETAHPKVLYYLHGIGGTADLSAEPLASFIKKNASVLGCRMPTIVGLSLGTRGVFRSDNIEIVRNAMIDFERSAFKFPDAVERHLIGVSMGGHNSLRFLMANPSAFKSASLLCPAIADINAYDPSVEQAYISRNRAVLDMNFFPVVWETFKRNFPTGAAWAANNPMEALRAGAMPNIPYFISTGRQDSVGFYEGAQHFVDAAAAKKLNVNWQPVDGPHCVFNQAGLEYFLISQFGSFSSSGPLCQ